MRSTTKLMKNWQFTGPDGKTTVVGLPHTTTPARTAATTTGAAPASTRRSSRRPLLTRIPNRSGCSLKA